MTDIFFFFTKPIMVKCLNIGQPIYRSISTENMKDLERLCMKKMVSQSDLLSGVLQTLQAL